ncbi:MAG TPA: MFS transporter [Burkholderiales bacterium]|nr:MFS transporter [Burkholderiales bacterium]
MRPIYLVAFTTLLVQGCHMGSRVVASLLAIKLGANPLEVGVLISVYAIFPLLLGLYSGRISDRLGPRKPMIAGAIGIAAGLVLPFLNPTLPALYVSCTLIGTGFVFFNVSNQTLGGALGTKDERTHNFATLGLGYAAGHFAGPVSVGYAIDHLGHTSAYLMLTAMAVLAAAIFALDPRFRIKPSETPRGSGHVFELLKLPLLRRAVIVSGLVTTGWDLYGFYVPIYGHSIGLSASTIGNILGVFAAATFIVRAVVARLTARFGIEPVLRGAAWIGAVFFVPFAMTEVVPVLFALSFGIGLALGCSQPLTLNLAYNYSPPGRAGEATGLRLTINNITHVGVPVASGALAAALGVAPVFWTCAALLVASGWLARADA